jgi:hypothetical protein
MLKKTPKETQPPAEEATPTPTQLAFFHLSIEPHHVVPDRRQADQTRRDHEDDHEKLRQLDVVQKEQDGEIRVLQARIKSHGNRKYVLQGWVIPYLQRKSDVEKQHPKYKRAAIEDEIRSQIAREELPPIRGLPSGVGLIRRR